MYSYSCCYIDEKKGTAYIGTTDGKIIKFGLIKQNAFSDFLSSNDNNFSILNKESTSTLIDLKGEIRDIQPISNDKLIAISSFGAIVLIKDHIQILKTENPSATHKLWRILIIDEESFIVSGNYGKLELWKLIDNNNIEMIKSLGTHSSGIFCLKFLDKNKSEIFTNDFRGRSNIIDIKSLKTLKEFIIDRNIQDFLLTDDNIFVCVNYFGNIFAYSYDENSNKPFKKIDQYTLTSFKGNFVSWDKEKEFIRIGTDNKTISLSGNLEIISQTKRTSKQMVEYGSEKCLLTKSDIIYTNFSDSEIPKELIKYQYVKIGLVGNSGTGKTSFCKFLYEEKFEDTISSFGKHVWRVNIGKNKLGLFFDLAGQRNELFTYFPYILDSDIVLLFFKVTDSDTFYDALQYYKELKYKCNKAKFFFIGTHSEQKPRVSDEQISKMFEELVLNEKEHIIFLSPKNRTGFQDFSTKVIDSICWSDQSHVTKSKIYENLEKYLDQAYMKGMKRVEFDELKEWLNIDASFLEKMLFFFTEQGIIEYLDESKILVLNDDDYEVTRSTICQTIDENKGYILTKDLFYEEDDKINIHYKKAILKYLRETGVGIFFKEEEENEIIVLKRMLASKSSKVSEFKSDSNNKVQFDFKEINIDLKTVLIKLSELDIEIYDIIKKSVLFGKENNFQMSITWETKKQFDSTRKIQFCYTTHNNEGKSSVNLLLKYYFNLIGSCIIDYNTDEQTVISEPDNCLITVLKHKFEKCFIDFKKLIDIGRNPKDEIMKDIIALANSSFSNSNFSFLVIGVEEGANYKISPVANIKGIEQFISQVSNNYINFAPILDFKTIKISEIQEWKRIGRIPSSVQINTSSNDDEILIIVIKRLSNKVFEISKPYKPHKIGDSWIRVSSHTFRLRENMREIIRRK